MLNVRVPLGSSDTPWIRVSITICDSVAPFRAAPPTAAHRLHAHGCSLPRRFCAILGCRKSPPINSTRRPISAIAMPKVTRHRRFALRQDLGW